MGAGRIRATLCHPISASRSFEEWLATATRLANIVVLAAAGGGGGDDIQSLRGNIAARKAAMPPRRLRRDHLAQLLSNNWRIYR